MVSLVKCDYKWLRIISIISLVIPPSHQEGDCHNPETEYSQVGYAPYEFHMSDIPFSTRRTMFKHSGTTQIIDYRYQVFHNCMLEVYMLSRKIEMPVTILKALVGINITKWIVNCDVEGIDVQPKPVIAVFKLLEAKAAHKRLSIPHEWLNMTDRAVLTIQMQTIPSAQDFTIVCNLEKSGAEGSIKLNGRLTIIKMGCPHGLYGQTCSMPCPLSCPATYSCHSDFGSPCFCPDWRNGPECHNDKPDDTVPSKTQADTSNDNNANIDNSSGDDKSGRPNAGDNTRDGAVIVSPHKAWNNVLYVIMIYRLISLL